MSINKLSLSLKTILYLNSDENWSSHIFNKSMAKIQKCQGKFG